jgi:hypothetical protein
MEIIIKIRFPDLLLWIILASGINNSKSVSA